MALFQGSVESKALAMQTGLTVYLPDDGCGPPERVLYLLHGLTDGCVSWLTSTRVCRYAKECRTAVMMPEGHRSFYLDADHGPSYFTYVSEELPALCGQLFGLNGIPALIAGNSMGGFGALRCFLSHPTRYAGCFAFSPVVSVAEFLPIAAAVGLPLDPISLPPETDLRLLTPPEKVPPFSVYCGTEDFLYPQNAAYDRWLTERGVPHRFLTGRGAHDWEDWDAMLADALTGL